MVLGSIRQRLRTLGINAGKYDTMDSYGQLGYTILVEVDFHAIWCWQLNSDGEEPLTIEMALARAAGTHIPCLVTFRYICNPPALPINKPHSVSPHLPFSLDSVRPGQRHPGRTEGAQFPPYYTCSLRPGQWTAQYALPITPLHFLIYFHIYSLLRE